MNTVEGTLIMGTVVKWFSGLAKGERRLEPDGSSGRKHNLSCENPVLPWFGGPAKTGTSGTGSGRSE